MMKTFGLAFALFLVALRAQAAPDAVVSLRFTTVSSSGRYAPLHVMAAWIEDSAGRHIRTLETHGGGHLRHLVAWKQATRRADPPADGVTGATLAAHRTHEIRWDGRDAQGQPAPAGAYVFLAEFTEDNGKGKLLRVPFTKGSQPSSLHPADEKHFKDIEVGVTPG